MTTTPSPPPGPSGAPPGPGHGSDIRAMQKQLFGSGSSAMRSRIESEMKRGGMPQPPER